MRGPENNDNKMVPRSGASLSDAVKCHTQDTAFSEGSLTSPQGIMSTYSKPPPPDRVVIVY